MDFTTGELIRKHRLKLGLSQKDVAAELDVSGPAVSKWERNCPIKESKLKAIAKLYTFDSSKYSTKTET